MLLLHQQHVSSNSSILRAYVHFTPLFSLPRTHVRSLIIEMRPRAHHSFYCSNARASGATELSIRMRLDNLADVESAHKGGDGRWRMQSWLLAVTSGTSVLCVNPHPLLGDGQRCSHQSQAQYTCWIVFVNSEIFDFDWCIASRVRKRDALACSHTIAFVILTCT